MAKTIVSLALLIRFLRLHKGMRLWVGNSLIPEGILLSPSPSPRASEGY